MGGYFQSAQPENRKIANLQKYSSMGANDRWGEEPSQEHRRDLSR